MRGAFNSKGVAVVAVVVLPHTRASAQQDGDVQQQLQELHSGYGLNSEGGQQVAFQAPGTEAKYRLGNEAETDGEYIFVNNWLNPEEHPDRAWVNREVMIEANTTNSTSYAAFPQTVVNGQVTSAGNDQFRLREAFVRGGHFLGDSQPDAIFWAGERYYRRQHIEIDDFYPLDLSGYGVGFEDVRLGNTKLAVSVLAGERPDIVPVICYLYILYYALSGSKPNSERYATA